MSKERIVEAALDILDTQGVTALTFRELTAQLQTGAGAIYWHVADKDELLAEAADRVLAQVVTAVPADAEPRHAIRAVALGMFEAFTAHPWLGTQLAREPWQPAMLHLYDGMGAPLQTLGVPADAQFNAATALVSYVVGLATQHAAAARLGLHDTDRAAFLDDVAATWTARDDATRRPFVQQLAQQLADHDDRKQFLAGIDLILAGIDTVR